MEDEDRSDFFRRCIIVAIAIVISTVSALTMLVLFGRPFVSDHVIKMVPWLEYGALYFVSALAILLGISLVGSVITYLYYSRQHNDEEVNGSLKKDQ
ncbi:unnamed protein product [Bursaphelenchus xylophilus]|uniref:(pine wood nematode) hypothetical protein n=1 Tax=Bursaphelenchus xylophilus TaxID=6326 RepID=A0A1I7RK38_BURXY|nr:unnamed protein product [Bursaphelenchus xylophilus]CAG9131531.1 unnamed protein product [Bursaphelenchus xylophilus]